jgi:hypothetical protein
MHLTSTVVPPYYYGVVGKLWYYRDGNTFLTNSKAGVHQGDPLGSVLFALAIHNWLMDLVGVHNVHVFGYADNLTLFGEVESVTDAAVQLREGFMEDGLALNGAESEFYFPAGGAPASVIDIGGDAPIPVAREGLKVLGGAVGTDAFCTHVL